MRARTPACRLLGRVLFRNGEGHRVLIPAGTGQGQLQKKAGPGLAACRGAAGAVYGQANFWMRLLWNSATKTCPPPSTATPTGKLNCASPLPALPHVVRKVPPLSNFWIRSLFPSATKTFPLPSTATATGKLNCPGPLPKPPHVVRKVPPLSNFWIRSLSVSATNTFPLPSTATPRGVLNCPGPLPPLPHVVRKVPPLSNFWMR